MKKSLVLILIFFNCSSGDIVNSNLTQPIDSTTTSIKDIATTSSTSTVIVEENPLLAFTYPYEDVLKYSDWYPSVSPYVQGPDCYIPIDSTKKSIDFYKNNPLNVLYVLSSENIMHISFLAWNYGAGDTTAIESHYMKDQFKKEIDGPINNIEDFIEIWEIEMLRVSVSYQNYEGKEFNFDKFIRANKIDYWDGNSTELDSLSNLDFLRVPIHIYEGSGYIKFFVYFKDGSWRNEMSDFLIMSDSIDYCARESSSSITGEYMISDQLIPLRTRKSFINEINEYISNLPKPKNENQNKSLSQEFNDNFKSFDKAWSEGTKLEKIVENLDSEITIVTPQTIDYENIETEVGGTFGTIEEDIEPADFFSGTGISYWSEGPGVFYGNDLLVPFSIYESGAGGFTGEYDGIFFEFKCSIDGFAIMGSFSPLGSENVAFSVCNK